MQFYPNLSQLPSTQGKMRKQYELFSLSGKKQPEFSTKESFSPSLNSEEYGIRVVCGAPSMVILSIVKSQNKFYMVLKLCCV